MVLAVAALDLFVDALLDLALEDTGTGGLVVVGNLEDMGSIDPVVSTTAHDMVSCDIELVDRHLLGSTTADEEDQAAYIAVRGRVDLAIR